MCEGVGFENADAKRVENQRKYVAFSTREMRLKGSRALGYFPGSFDFTDVSETS